MLAGWLKCSRAYVKELSTKGIVRRVGNGAAGGGYPLKSSVNAYVEHLRQRRAQDQSPRSAAAAEHHRLKAQLVAYQIAKHERDHVTLADYEEMIETMSGTFLVALAALPAHMVGNDLVARRKWEAYVFDVRQGAPTLQGVWQKRPSAMTDAELERYVERTEAFIDGFFALLANTEPVNQNAGRQLVAIARTIDAVDYIDLCNLATLNEACTALYWMRSR